MPLSSGVEVALLSMQPHRFIQVRGKKASGLRWPQVMDHKQLDFPSKELSPKHGNAGFGQKKMETLETFRRAWEQRGTESRDHSLESSRPQGNSYKCLWWEGDSYFPVPYVIFLALIQCSRIGKLWLALWQHTGTCAPSTVTTQRLAAPRRELYRFTAAVILVLAISLLA